MNAIKNLIRGNQLFKKYHFTDYKEDLEDLIKNGQKPEVLFICCCDSRITPDLMLGSKPGDLFVLRNIGNFVPPYSSEKGFHGISSAIEYAISILKVSNVIVCAHSHCGAIQSLYKDIPNDAELFNIKKWLLLGEKAKEETSKLTFKNKEDLYKQTEKNSVKYQLDNLLSYPIIKKRVEEKTLQLHAWYYELKDGSISYYDQEENNFKELSKYYDESFLI